MIPQNWQGDSSGFPLEAASAHRLPIAPRQKFQEIGNFSAIATAIWPFNPRRENGKGCITVFNHGFQRFKRISRINGSDRSNLRLTQLANAVIFITHSLSG
jgi:hypothetical protein